MKQRRDGEKIINWHMPLRPDDLKRRYIQNRVEAVDSHLLSWEDDDDGLYGDDALCYDDYWNYGDRGDGFDYLLTEAVYLLEHELAGIEAPLLVPPTIESRPADQSPQLPELLVEGGSLSAGGDLGERLHCFLSALRSCRWSLPNDKRAPVTWPPVAFAALVKRACHEARDQLTAVREALPPGRSESLATLSLIVAFAPFWIRTPRSWLLPTGNASTKLRALIDHLFVQFPAPPILYANWLRVTGVARAKWLCWLILLGQGEGLRKAARVFGWSIAKSLEQHLWKVPDGLGPMEGCMYAEVLRLGGGETEFRRLLRNPAFVIDPTAGSENQIEGVERREDLPTAHLAFWRETVRWLSRHRDELTDDDAELILRWSMHRFTEERREGGAFSWKGKRPERTRQSALEFERAVQDRVPLLSWADRGWNRTLQRAGEDWSFHELLTSRELSDEGRTLHHCVAGYAHACQAGRAAIFSVQRNGTRILTIEVRPEPRALVQVRGLCNRAPSSEERTVVDEWWRGILQHCSADGRQ